MYHVAVGEGVCKNVEVTDNSISCQAPKSEPRDLYENKPRVKVRKHNGFSK